MTAHTIFRPKQVTSIKFGSKDFTDADYSSQAVAIDTAFATNNSGIPTSGTAVSNDPGIVMVDLVGTRAVTGGTARPAYSEAFAKDISFSGNERGVEEENLLGADTSSTQNQETVINPASLLEVTLTIVYRNPTPTSIFTDETKCCLMELDNEESSSSGVLNLAFKSITVLQVGALSLTADGGMMEQTVKFSCKGGTVGDPISVDSGTEIWYRIKGGNYLEEVRVA